MKHLVSINISREEPVILWIVKEIIRLKSIGEVNKLCSFRNSQILIPKVLQLFSLISYTEFHLAIPAPKPAIWGWNSA